MRVTRKMVADRQQNSLNNSLVGIDASYQRISSGKKYERISENPREMIGIIQLKSEMNDNKKYDENIEDALNWLDSTETITTEMVSQMHRFKELMISASTSGDDTGAIRSEVNQIIQSIGGLLNTKHDDRYLLSGKTTHTKPFEFAVGVDNSLVSFEYVGADSAFEAEIGEGIFVPYSMTGEKLVDGENLGNLFMDATNALETHDKSDINSLLMSIDNHVDHLLSSLGKIGARVNRMEMAQKNHERINSSLTELLSKKEDTDISKEIIELTSHQQLHEVSVGVTEKIMNLSLMDII